MAQQTDVGYSSTTGGNRMLTTHLRTICICLLSMMFVVPWATRSGGCCRLDGVSRTRFRRNQR